MAKVNKIEYILEGLDCANCAAKIEARAGKINGVSSASMNFAAKTLTVEAGERAESLTADLKRIVGQLEPHVRVMEKQAAKNYKKVLILNGLGCANCAAKIENEVKGLPGVRQATLDFVTRKLTLETGSRQKIEAADEEASRIAKRIEPDIIVTEENEKLDKEVKGTDIKKLIRLGAGAVIFLTALLFRLPFLLEFGLCFISYILVGGEVLVKAANNILNGQLFDESFLMSLATIGAFAIGEFPEAVAVMLFYKAGQFLEELAVNRSRRSISALMDIRPEYANLKTGGEVRKVPPDEVKIGDIILVRPGEKVPLDGKVLEGRSMLDTSALTGESVLREVSSGDEVLSGSVNKNGLLTIKASKEFGESAVSKILDLVENAAAKKAPTENFIAKFARYYTPVVVFAAFALAVIPPLLTGAPFMVWLNRALVFLVVSCPCALVISIPLGFFGGIGGASRQGILIKGSSYLEALNYVDTVVFDKTGTLTKGVFKVTKVIDLLKIPGESILEYAAYAESYSSHPIATSILEAYGKETDKKEISGYEEISGFGIKVRVKGRNILAGNTKLMEKENIPYYDAGESGTAVHIAVDGKYAGYILISDEIKEDSKTAVKALRELGVRKLVMLTGDNKQAGGKIGKELGLDEVYAELLPDMKVEKLEMLAGQKPTKGKLVFVGDGINDAPVLARADIGVAMGGIGSDAAIEAADIILMTDEPSKLVSAVKTAKRTRRIVWQNIVFALGIKAVVLLLGAGGAATIWEAVFADVGVTVLAVLNSMRAMKINKA